MNIKRMCMCLYNYIVIVYKSATCKGHYRSLKKEEKILKNERSSIYSIFVLLIEERRGIRQRSKIIFFNKKKASFIILSIAFTLLFNYPLTIKCLIIINKKK